MMIHKRRGGGLGWNYAGLTITLVVLVGVVAAGAVEFALVPGTLARLVLGALIFAVVLRAGTRRRYVANATGGGHQRVCASWRAAALRGPTG